MKAALTNIRGFTLIEIVLLIVVAGILSTVAFRTILTISESAKTEETKQELETLAYAVTGNPELQNNGIRTNLGYVGDVGAMPASLDALHSNPGGYSTWNGPYIENRFTQVTDDYKRDAWGNLYQYSGVTITSTGGSGMVRKLANSVDDLLLNSVGGTVLDLDGTPPGPVYNDSLSVRLTMPDGAGSMMTRTRTPDAGGNFSFDSIPIGNHDIRILYMPSIDTVKRFVSVLPASSLYNEYYLPSNVWHDTAVGGAGLSYVNNSDTLLSANCFKLLFWITNSGTSAISVNWIKLTWSSPTAYYKLVLWGAITVRDGNPALTSGSTANFTSTQILNPGQSIQILIDGFHADPGGGGPPVDMSNTTFTVQFSDGSTFSFTADLCL
ncbi:MAG TPA: hypothetical protein VN285_04700 [Candidatus Deferrimicrobium sp.]|nr:hypothetical protein [Candidatus Deferrimicrobium sp.]